GYQPDPGRFCESLLAAARNRDRAIFGARRDRAYGPRGIPGPKRDREKDWPRWPMKQLCFPPLLFFEGERIEVRGSRHLPNNRPPSPFKKGKERKPQWVQSFPTTNETRSCSPQR